LKWICLRPIGSNKNPVSHRTVALEDATEAGEMLMRIVEARKIMRLRRQAEAADA